jgi:hypothetical protein
VRGLVRGPVRRAVRGAVRGGKVSDEAQTARETKDAITGARVLDICTD